jgi:hypothetical protein
MVSTASPRTDPLNTTASSTIRLAMLPPILDFQRLSSPMLLRPEKRRGHALDPLRQLARGHLLGEALSTAVFVNRPVRFQRQQIVGESSIQGPRRARQRHQAPTARAESWK